MVFKFSAHALKKMQTRALLSDDVLHVLKKPQQIVNTPDGVFYQSVFTDEINQHAYLLRVLVNPDTCIIITAYKTSQISKYWLLENKTHEN